MLPLLLTVTNGTLIAIAAIIIIICGLLFIFGRRRL
jgi:type IV secretory pathway VirB2 component (pilin)